ncbi:Putative DNA-invertase from lambdoid prophage Rac [Oligella ureolytica]|uniref:DNA-invertase from lambdoid prophage Rac n=1 Tax=Oligella ureolytica TaxID=90244 RepID=A0A379B0G0_9BURK|nr:recombinase family protein [Oligella ureolytica]QPT38932.1 recombinase family protein [Oligella ureolytica]SUB29825.1 Putative DNA-invertase from lambdoid prophage Rac [Oligella ureolytica]
MPTYYAYLRVSRDGQDPENQKLGLLEYANSRGFAPLHIEEEIASRAKDWRKRKIGRLIEQAQRGDVILTPEFSRIAGSALAALEILKAASERGLIVHVTKQQIVMDGSLQSDIMATVLGLAAQIERHFIQTRTKEALQVARQRGKTLGRPKGSTASYYKLDDRIQEVQAFVNLGLSQRRAAELLGVSPNTLRLFIKRRRIKPTGTQPTVTMPEPTA